MSAFVALSTVLAKSEADENSLWFECPGCGMMHGIAVGTGQGPRWGWNGDVNEPTFTPSILVQWNEGPVNRRCHSFVKEGRIQFLNDCTHALAGQTVDLPPFEI